MSYADISIHLAYSESTQDEHIGLNQDKIANYVGGGTLKTPIP
jgi:hypothetical protein